MSLLTIVFSAVAVSASLILTINHLIPGNGYVFGNAEFFTAIAEVGIIVQVFLFSGTISSLLINSIAGLFIGTMLMAGRFFYGGKKVGWSWANRKNGKFGFSVTEIPPAITSETLPEFIANTFKSTAIVVWNMTLGIFNAFFTPKPELEPEMDHA